MAILPHPGCDLSDNVVDQVGIATIETTFNEDGQTRSWLGRGQGTPAVIAAVSTVGQVGLVAYGRS